MVQKVTVRFVLILGALQVSCGTFEPSHPDWGEKSQPILGGTAAQPGQFPSVLMLETGCTAVLVHPQHFVTAAHCIDTEGPGYAFQTDEVEVEVLDDGSLIVNGDSLAQPLEVESCVLHPRAKEVGFDLGVCRLARRVDVIPSVISVDPVQEGDEVVLVGYGFDRVEGQAGRKRYVHTLVLGVTGESDGQELVIGDAQNGTCRGDSGGPAFSSPDDTGRVSLVGILSGGESGTCGVGWYTNVPLHLTWLEEATDLHLEFERRGTGEVQPTRGRNGDCGLAGPPRSRPSFPWFVLFPGLLLRGLLRFLRRCSRAHPLGSCQPHFARANREF